MADKIFYIPNRIVDADGIADGAAMYVYQSGGTTPVPLFSDEDLTAPVSNPYVVSTGALVPALYTSYTGDLRFRVVGFDSTILQDEDPYVPITSVATASQVPVTDGGSVQDALDNSAVYDPEVTAVDHQRVGRTGRYTPTNILLPGAWIKSGTLRSRDIMLSPYNSGSDNLSAWNEWRDEMQTLQERQEGRTLTLTMDEDEFLFAGSNYIDVRQSYINIEGRGAKINGVGIRATNAASVNPQLYFRIRDITVANAPQDGFHFVDSYYLNTLRTSVEGAARYGYNFMGGNNITVRDPIAIDCTHYGLVAQRAMNARPGATTTEVALIAMLVDNPDFRSSDVGGAGTLGGGIALYEAESVRVNGGTIQGVTGGTYGRGISIERGRKVTIEGIHFEANDVDVYVDTTVRVASSWSNHAIRILDCDCSATSGIIFAESVPIEAILVANNRLAGNLTQSSGHVSTTGVVTADNYIAGSVGLASSSIVDMRNMFDASGLKLPSGDAVYVGANKIIGARQAAIPGPVGGATADTESRTVINAIRAALQAHGLIET